jgi:hypothetical protein
MDSGYHATVMQRPDEEDEGARRERERINGTSSSNTRPGPYDARSPTQTDFHFSPPNGTHPRPQFNNPYHPPTPTPLPIPTGSHIPRPSPSPMTGGLPSTYQNEYQPPRDKPTSNYYDPTSDAGVRPPAENSGWNEGHAQTPQVRKIIFTLRETLLWYGELLTSCNRVENNTSINQHQQNRPSITTDPTPRPSRPHFLDRPSPIRIHSLADLRYHNHR